MVYLIHCNNLCKCHNVPPPITTIKEKKEPAGKIKNIYILDSDLLVSFLLVESFTEVALRGGDKCQKSTCVLRAP
jgi:hypothetical protein